MTATTIATTTATHEKEAGFLERGLRAFSSEQAQRAVATLEVAVPIPAISSIVSAINFAQHSCATCINVIDGEISRGIINACQAVADVGQGIAGFLPIGETIVDIASFGLEFADSLISSYEKGTNGERPPLSPKMSAVAVPA